MNPHLFEKPEKRADKVTHVIKARIKRPPRLGNTIHVLKDSTQRLKQMPTKLDSGGPHAAHPID